MFIRHHRKAIFTMTRPTMLVTKLPHSPAFLTIYLLLSDQRRNLKLLHFLPDFILCQQEDHKHMSIAQPLSQLLSSACLRVDLP